MFCQKCGNKVPEGSDFCPKCGTKLVVDVPRQTQSEPASTVASAPTPSTPQLIQPQGTEGVTSSANGFHEFVDNYVRANTKFTSAQDLLTKSKPLSFIWKCIGTVAIIWFLIVIVRGTLRGIGDVLLSILVIGIFGYSAAYVGGRIKYAKLWVSTNKTEKKYPVTQEVEIEKLSQFLNANLQYLSPAFSNWASGAFRGSNAVKCDFQGNKTSAVISFDITNEGKLFYSFSAQKAKVWAYVVTSGSGLSAGNTNAGFGEYSCLYRAAPILIAAVGYYLQSTNSQYSGGN